MQLHQQNTESGKRSERNNFLRRVTRRGWGSSISSSLLQEVIQTIWQGRRLCHKTWQEGQELDCLWLCLRKYRNTRKIRLSKNFWTKSYGSFEFREPRIKELKAQIKPNFTSRAFSPLRGSSTLGETAGGFTSRYSVPGPLNQNVEDCLENVLQWPLHCNLFSYHCHHLRFLGKKTDSRAERYSDNNNLRSELTLRFSPTPVSFWTASNAEQIMHQKMTETCPLGLTLLLFPAWGQQALSPPRCGGQAWGGSWLGAPS